MDRKPHFFFAVSLPEEVKKELSRLCLTIKERLPFQRWVHQDDYHITLAFLGTAQDGKLEKAKKLVVEQLNGQSSFSLHINKLGVFGKKDSPRIFWADTVKEDKLLKLRERVFFSCLEAGFELETRAFKPHITLARKWAGSTPFEEDLLESNNPFEEASLPFQAKEVALYQTHFDRTPKYEKIAAFPLLTE
ncbi:RNA 2',3'-cyclic phosphodiesterase [Cytobacillus massiliigabonensis]|uniref:RNA 2',3'-cyclic phosphodiesterase n=1 Tax=Cytobacillus massiliigabonensis TaxID=1871011 RepID=UPI000C82572A|nr:RNA 2',3'-cyclic phosphodiesterase [Cytobacillus massiliigabonensis]